MIKTGCYCNQAVRLLRLKDNFMHFQMVPSEQMLPIRNTAHFDVIIDPTKLEATKGGFDTTTNPVEAKFVDLPCIQK
jgi:hypothetical protein